MNFKFYVTCLNLLFVFLQHIFVSSSFFLFVSSCFLVFLNHFCSLFFCSSLPFFCSVIYLHTLPLYLSSFSLCPPYFRHLWRIILPSVGVPQHGVSGRCGSTDRALGTVTHRVSPCCPPQLLIVARVTSSAGTLLHLLAVYSHTILQIS